MPSLSARLLTPSGAARRLLTFQALFLVVAIGLFGITWITDWTHSDFVGIFLYTFVTGNLTSLGMTRIYPHFAGLRNPYRWLAYLGLLFALALASSTVGVLVIMAAFRMPFSNFRAEFWVSGRLGTMMITLVGIIYHAYTESRSKLERRNVELQRSVDVAETHSRSKGRNWRRRERFRRGCCPRRFRR
jgi:hypothetical protein